MTTPEPTAPAAPLLGEEVREDCWLCHGLGGLAVHDRATVEFGKPLWVAHRPRSRTHEVKPCPVCSVAALVAERERAVREHVADQFDAQATSDRALRTADIWGGQIPVRDLRAFVRDLLAEVVRAFVVGAKTDDPGLIVKVRRVR